MEEITPAENFIRSTIDMRADLRMLRADAVYNSIQTMKRSINEAINALNASDLDMANEGFVQMTRDMGVVSMNLDSFNRDMNRCIGRKDHITTIREIKQIRKVTADAVKAIDLIKESDTSEQMEMMAIESKTNLETFSKQFDSLACEMVDALRHHAEQIDLKCSEKPKTAAERLREQKKSVSMDILAGLHAEKDLSYFSMEKTNSAIAKAFESIYDFKSPIGLMKINEPSYSDILKYFYDAVGDEEKEIKLFKRLSNKTVDTLLASMVLFNLSRKLPAYDTKSFKEQLESWMGGDVNLCDMEGETLKDFKEELRKTYFRLNGVSIDEEPATEAKARKRVTNFMACVLLKFFPAFDEVTKKFSKMLGDKFLEEKPYHGIVDKFYNIITHDCAIKCINGLRSFQGMMKNIVETLTSGELYGKKRTRLIDILGAITCSRLPEFASIVSPLHKVKPL